MSTDLYGWKCHTLKSGDATLAMPTEIGPRIVSCTIDGADNLFHVIKEEQGGFGEPDWMLRGGHRLWHSPEQNPRSYDPDNTPIKVAEIDEGREFLLEAPGPDHSGMVKSIQIAALGAETFKLTHRIRNTLQWPVQFAPWALTVMERGGYSTIPLLPKGDHETDLLPNYTMVPWTYTDFSRPEWEFHQDFIGIDTTKTAVAQKLGLTNYPGWAAYWQPAGTFVKAAHVELRKTYPDFGCVYETFCNDFMIELETLGPLTTVPAGGAIEHVEYWGVFAGLPKPDSDKVFNEEFRPIIEGWRTDLIS
ncbi:hypothetical protein [Cerasicoccus arenae]|uniref:Uncharacterized protein n=1 Tax=Cerasicoccus arenae TaxID=424488 RepID=A0A8J3GCP4_9BACT|nr:hypothetical protein [Cerasicoccus arenae]MBK1857534.1 hypothetical protein [Cerasicoccus arenae]GHB95570.1 hypothetical protein GCM10007047_09230 [Cerasicoccus arenae]